jgi:hypothetical protein
MTVLNRAGRVTQLFVSFDRRMATILSTSTLKTKNIKKVRAHDAICGILYLASVGLTIQTGNLDFLYISIGVGILQVISPFTKFCPVYFTLNKVMSDTDPMQNGK